MSIDLNPQKALIFRIMHRENIPWILDDGLHCRNADIADPHYVGIGNAELIDKRSRRAVPCAPGGTLSDYIPFYFTPFSPMMLNIKTGYGGIQKRLNAEIVILVSSLHCPTDNRISWIFSDRHAYLAAAQFYGSISDLDVLDWPMLQQRNFRRDPSRPDSFERYQAEALVYKHLPVSGLLGAVCYDRETCLRLQEHLATRNLRLRIAPRPKWYF